MRTRRWMTVGVMLTCAQWSAAEDVAKTCQTTGWDMQREIAAFGAVAGSVAPGPAAGTIAKEAKTLKAGLLGELTLMPQADVQFLKPPERPAKQPMPLAGLAQFNVPTTGNYRITVDIPLWLDAVTLSAILPSAKFNGWHECSLFRKTVQYSLQAGQVVVLQFSGATTDLVKVLIEPVAPAT